MAPARPARVAVRLLPLSLLVAAAEAMLSHAAPARVEPLIPDSATGAGAAAEPWPEVVLPKAPQGSAPTSAPAPTQTPSAAPTSPERPSRIPSVVPVGDLALQPRPSRPGEAAAMPPEPLHYPLAVAPSEQDPWGWRFSAARGVWRMHTGVDLIAPQGTAVLAVNGGRVQRVDRIAGYGLSVLIDHGGGWSSLYAHLLQATVSPGEPVRAGQPLGLVGQSGSASTPHLHLELRQRQPQGLVAVDPTPLLSAPPAAGAIAGDRRP